MKENFLREAIRLSHEKMEAGAGGPFGAVVVKDGRIVARGWNRVTSTNDPTAHAEITAIREACRALGSFSLKGCEIYVNCEPCPMCLAAIYWARLDHVYFAADRQDAARIGFDDERFYREISLTPEQRSVQADQALREEALPALEAWARKPDRVDY